MQAINRTAPFRSKHTLMSFLMGMLSIGYKKEDQDFQRVYNLGVCKPRRGRCPGAFGGARVRQHDIAIAKACTEAKRCEEEGKEKNDPTLLRAAEEIRYYAYHPGYRALDLMIS